MNLIYSDNKNHLPVNIDTLLYLKDGRNNGYTDIDFQLNDGHGVTTVTWDCDSEEEVGILIEKVKAHCQATNISTYTTL